MLPAFVELLAEEHPTIAAFYLSKLDEFIMEIADVRERGSSGPAKGL